jgi:hypothetical protein
MKSWVCWAMPPGASRRRPELCHATAGRPKLNPRRTRRQPHILALVARDSSTQAPLGLLAL